MATTEALAVRYRGATGAALISVTQTLQLAGRIDDQWFTEESRARGQAVHTATEEYDRGDDVTLPDEWMGYLEAYADFLAVVKPVYLHSELKVTSDVHGFAGRIDRVCRSLFGVPGLLDFKTGGPSAWHGQQLAAYNVLCPMGARWACYLGANGRYKLVCYDDHADHAKFMYDLARTRGTVTADGDYWI